MQKCQKLAFLSLKTEKKIAFLCHLCAFKNTLGFIISGVRYQVKSLKTTQTLLMSLLMNPCMWFLCCCCYTHWHACQLLNGCLSPLAKDIKWLWVTVLVSVCIQWISEFWWHAAGKLVTNLEMTCHAEYSSKLHIDQFKSFLSNLTVKMSAQRQQTWENRSRRGWGANVHQKWNNGVHQWGQQVIYSLPPTSSSGGQCHCLKGIQLIKTDRRVIQPGLQTW